MQHAKQHRAWARLAHEPAGRRPAAQRVIDQPGNAGAIRRPGETVRQAPILERVSRRPPLFFGLAAFAVDKAADNVIAPYSVAVDSVGNVYVGEVTYTYGIKLGRVPEDHAPHQVQKFTAPQAAPRGEAVR